MWRRVFVPGFGGFVLGPGPEQIGQGGGGESATGSVGNRSFTIGGRGGSEGDRPAHRYRMRWSYGADRAEERVERRGGRGTRGARLGGRSARPAG